MITSHCVSQSSDGCKAIRENPLDPCAKGAHVIIAAVIFISKLRSNSIKNLLNGIPRIQKSRCCTHARLKYQSLCLLHIYRQSTDGTTSCKIVKLLLEACHRVREEGNVSCREQNGQDKFCNTRSVKLWAGFQQRPKVVGYPSLSCCRHWAKSSCQR